MRRSQQPNPTTQAVQTEHWTRLILSYARHARVFTIGVEDAELKTGPWADILSNPTIARSSPLLRLFLYLKSCIQVQFNRYT